MKMYNLAFLLLSQIFFCCKQAAEIPTTGQQTDTNVSGGIVFKSADGGKTWQDISNGLPEPVQDNYGIGRNVFYTDDNGVYLADGNWIYHSNTNATAPFWTREFFPDKHASIIPGKNGIFAYSYLDGIVQKTNGTDKWLPVFTNFTGKQVRTVLETSGGAIFIGSDNGLFKSTNSGQTWKQVQTGGWVMKMVEQNGVLVATSQQGIIRSTDEGDNWDLVISEGGVGIDVERIKGGFAAISYSTAAGTRRIRTSYDGGQTWQLIDAGFPGQAAIDAPWQFIHTSNRVQGSTDSAWHVKEATPAMPEYKTSIIQVGENFFCGHTDGIYKTADKGKTWQLVLRAAKGKMFILSVSGNVMYALQTESHC